VNKKVPYLEGRTDLSSSEITLEAGELYYIYFEQINNGGAGYG